MENTSREKSYQHIFNYFSKVFSVDVIEYSTKRKKLHLPRIPYKLLTDLLQDATLIFKSEPNIIRINSPVVVVGDIHGHILDLFRILKKIGCPSLKTNQNDTNNSKNNNNKQSTELNSEYSTPNIHNIHNNRRLKNCGSHLSIQNTNSNLLDQEYAVKSSILQNNPILDNKPTINESTAKYLFLGDFVDRGQFSFETIVLILTMKILFPNEILIVRGNHEFKEIFMQGVQSFGVELHDLYPNQTDEVSDAFENCFSYIPLAAIIDNNIICLHGGVGTSLKEGDLNLLDSEISRPIHNFDNPVVADVLWSDPSEYILHFQPSSRGSGCLFGLSALNNFLSQTNLHRIIRGHQCVEEGFLSLWDDRCLTVFSASNYCGALNNKTGVLRISNSGTSIKAEIYNPIPVLSRSAAIFDEFQKWITYAVNGLPNIQNGNLLLAVPRTPLSVSRRSRFENRAKSQMISRGMSPNESRAVHSVAASPSPLVKKRPQTLLHPHSKKSHESMSLQPLKKGPVV